MAPFGAAAGAALVAGILACLCLPELPPWPVLALAFALGLRGWIACRQWGRLAGIALLGIGLCGLHAARTLERQLPPRFERADVGVTGTVVDLPRHEPDRTAFRFRVDQAPAGGSGRDDEVDGGSGVVDGQAAGLQEVGQRHERRLGLGEPGSGRRVDRRGRDTFYCAASAQFGIPAAKLGLVRHHGGRAEAALANQAVLRFLDEGREVLDDDVLGLVHVASTHRWDGLQVAPDVVRELPSRLRESQTLRLQRLYPKAKLMSGGEAVVVPLPTAGGERVADADLIAWVGQLLDQLWPVKTDVAVSESA